MLEELQRRNYSENTTRSYIRTVEDFARRFHCPPDQLGPRQIREYQAELFQKRKLSPGTVAIRLAALRFFYTKTLNRAWSIAETPYPKKAHRIQTHHVCELEHEGTTFRGLLSSIREAYRGIMNVGLSRRK
jgi:integrase/recombinase XerD